MMEVHERLHRDPVVAGGRGGDRIDLVDRQGERLLAEDVLAGVEGPDRPLGVQAVRQRDVDDVDEGVGEQGVERRMRDRGPMALGERAGRALVAAGDRAQLAARIAVQGPHDPRRDPTRPEDAPSELFDRPPRGPPRRPSSPASAIYYAATTRRVVQSPRPFEQEEHKSP